jgi:hypothetical protein
LRVHAQRRDVARIHRFLHAHLRRHVIGNAQAFDAFGVSERAKRREAIARRFRKSRSLARRQI